MPWEFHAVCPDCSHEWDGLTWFEHISDGDSRTPTEGYFCTDCCTHLSVKTDFDRLSFRNWLRGNQRRVNASPTLQHNVALISSACETATGYLFSMDNVWGNLLCVPCNRPLIRNSIDNVGIRCPQCSGRNAKSQGCHSHVSVLREIKDETVVHGHTTWFLR